MKFVRVEHFPLKVSQFEMVGFRAALALEHIEVVVHTQNPCLAVGHLKVVQGEQKE